ncbi:MAG TPA: metalloregulator ArsR/SmtB family transcription factor [Anaerolineales bacterium]|nr:metalloregulator ArsR/SmtB family transcription factor [Anaerolineales bacterium]
MKPTFSLEVQDLAERQAMLCKVFSNAQRVLILWFLAEQERTVSEIAEAIGASLPSASQHLHFMELSNILASRRERQNIYYHLAENELLRNCLVLVNKPKGQLMEIESQTQPRRTI